MSESMELSEQQLNQIGGYVKQNLGVWMKEVVPMADALVTQNIFGVSTAITVLLGS